MSIASIRRDYMRESLSESDVSPNPFRQFDRWWDEAIRAEIDEVNAMTLSTVSVSGRPSSRIVLLKGYDDDGFVFFTNYRSRKGREIADNPHVSLLFFWKELERQVRVEGLCVPVSEAESDSYFFSRPEGSRVGAWASPQSERIASREVLDDNLSMLSEKFRDTTMPRPAHWGGYRVSPATLEFWQGRPNRLHDRMLYDKSEGGEWSIHRLAP
jgi:pyridoxamine 5'-phosphate oxidase